MSTYNHGGPYIHGVLINACYMHTVAVGMD